MTQPAFYLRYRISYYNASWPNPAFKYMETYCDRMNARRHPKYPPEHWAITADWLPRTFTFSAKRGSVDSLTFHFLPRKGDN